MSNITPLRVFDFLYMRAYRRLEPVPVNRYYNPGAKRCSLIHLITHLRNDSHELGGAGMLFAWTSAGLCCYLENEGGEGCAKRKHI